jgi:hypothetical protein
VKLSIVPPKGGGLTVGTRYRVYLDDVQVFPTGVRIDMGNHREPPTVTLDVPVYAAERVDLDDPMVLIPDSTRDLLIRIGWTPPAPE